MNINLKKDFTILLIVLLACVVYIWGLWEEGLGNLYYSAGVYSMGKSLHAFFYNSIDSIGFISIDKPPLGLWIQVLFTKLIGFNGMAVLLPQALAGVLSVYMLYKIVSKRARQFAGIIAAIVLALTPILAAVNRNNTMDGILILILILASELSIQAAEKSSLKHFIFANILIALGFNVKMLQSYMIVPAVYLTYLFFSNQRPLKKVASCTMSFVILLTVSFSWVVAVDLTPKQNRPFVGSSRSDSAMNLALGNNGIKRLIGVNPGGKSNISEQNFNENSPKQPQVDRNIQANERSKNKGAADNNQAVNKNLHENHFPQNFGNDKKGPGGEGGPTSLFRLYNDRNAGQISWFLLPAFLVCVFCLYLLLRKRLEASSINITLFYWTMCFLPMFCYFSFSSGMVHRYYLAMFAPSIAGLIGIGVKVLFERNKLNKYVLPVIFGVSAVAQLYIQRLYNSWLEWLLPTCAILFTISFIYLVINGRKQINSQLKSIILSVLLILPGIWAFTPIIYGNNAQLPIAGPELVKQGDLFDKRTDLSGLVTYLDKNRQGAQYIAAVPSAMSMGAELIIQSGEPVMILGGFNGGDNPITLNQFKDLVLAGKVKFALITRGNDKSVSNNSINEWISKNGKYIDEKLWSNDNRQNGLELYQLN